MDIFMLITCRSSKTYSIDSRLAMHTHLFLYNINTVLERLCWTLEMNIFITTTAASALNLLLEYSLDRLLHEGRV